MLLWSLFGMQDPADHTMGDGRWTTDIYPQAGLESGREISIWNFRVLITARAYIDVHNPKRFWAIFDCRSVNYRNAFGLAGL